MGQSDHVSDERPMLFGLHYLGGSGRAWDPVFRRLDGFRCVAVDLPGFGDAAGIRGYTVAEMADHVASVVRAAGARRWALLGHSMGAKVAAVLARRAEDGEGGLAGLTRLVLLAGSPPGPEPMQESQRQTMLGWFTGDPASSRAEAQGYVSQNVGSPLDAASNEAAVADVLRTSRDAWAAWLGQGSREDWSARVGVLRTPALLVAGAEDGELCADAQRRHMAPHFATVRVVTLSGAGHLLPLERPDELARLIAGEVPGPMLGVAYRAFIESSRVSRQTRETLLARAQPDDPAYRSTALTMDQLATLRTVLDRVLPQTGPVRIDLGARIDAMLAAGQGDGWRFAALPPDAEAYRAALRTLGAHGFAALDVHRQDEALRLIAAGGLPDRTPAEPGLLDAEQMRLWFEDLRADAVRLYVGHPATLARMGYSGIGNGGDGPRLSGFTAVGAGMREAWEPEVFANGETPA